MLEIVDLLESITAIQWVVIIGGGFIAIWLSYIARALRW
jgi:hypothetical protein